MIKQGIGTTHVSGNTQPKKRTRGIKSGTIKRIIKSFGRYRATIILVLIIAALTVALELVVPVMIPPMFNDAFAHHNMNHLILYGLIMIGATIASALSGVAETYLSNKVGQNVMRDFRNRLYAHLQEMSLSFFTSTRTGEIQSRLSNDISGAQGAITNTFLDAIKSIFSAVGTIAVMLYLSPLLTLISFFMLPLFIFFAFKIGKIRRGVSLSTQESLATLSALMQETLSISGIMLIKTFGRKKIALSRFEDENQKLTEISMHQQMIGQWFFAFMGSFNVLAPVILYMVVGWLVIYNSNNSYLSIGILFAFLTLQSRFYGPFTRLLSLQVNLQGSLAMFDRIFEYIDIPIEIREAPDAVWLAPDEASGRVSFKNVSFTYKSGNYLPENEADDESNAQNGNEIEKPFAMVEQALSSQTPHTTLKNISFTTEPGQLVALVGPSGAGKTTLTYLLSRLYDVDTGSIEIDDHDVRTLSMASLGELIGVVTQETYLFHTSIRENLLYVRPEATEEEMIAATSAAAIHERIMELDDGYDTIVGERGYRLSGGEKQRVAIARVLLKNPRILILDEATSSLDTHSERLIQAALQPLIKGRTTIAIAHRLSTILAADLILVVNKGEIVERGSHQQLLAYSGVYTQLYKQQFEQQEQEESSSKLPL